MTEDRDGSNSSSGASQHETTPSPSSAADNSNKNNGTGPSQPRRHFLYADYTPLQDDRNLIEMLKAFVSLAAQVIRRHETDVKCLSLLDDSELLRKEVASAIRNARVTTAGALDRFYERNSGIFASVAGLQSASGNAFVTGAKTSLEKMLADVELNTSQQQEKHKENIRSIMNANRSATVDAMQAWLSDENRDFPYPVLESLSAELAVDIDPASSNDSYKVIRTASAAAAAMPYKKEGEEPQQQKKKASDKIMALSRFMYVSEFNTAGVEFWNYRKKVIDFGIEELMLPTGMKLPMSEKVKSTFRLSSRKEEPAKEPHFIKADDFYVSSVVLRGRKTLEVLLASDLAAAIAGPAGGEEGRGELFTLVFDASSGLADDSATLEAIHPVVRYTDNKEQAIMAETNLLQIKEIEQATNLRKLATLGAAVLAKLQILQDPRLLASRGKLNLLAVEEKEAIAASGRRTAGSDAAAALVFVEFPLIFNLIEALARSFGPVVERLKEKTPVKEELILRQELEGGQRKEFAVRLDELRSQLGETPFGKSVFRTVFGA